MINGGNVEAGKSSTTAMTCCKGMCTHSCSEGSGVLLDMQMG